MLWGGSHSFAVDDNASSDIVGMNEDRGNRTDARLAGRLVSGEHLIADLDLADRDVAVRSHDGGIGRETADRPSLRRLANHLQWAASDIVGRPRSRARHTVRA